MSIILLIIGLILFVGLVVIHEFGHFIAAKRNGVEVEEFGVGFPPRAKLLTKKKGTEYTLNWLPLGGFVKLKGENTANKQKGSFGRASLWAKVQIMLAGVVMNLITAFVLLSIVAVAGIPRLVEDQFTVDGDTQIVQQRVLAGFVESGSPAEEAGITQHDELKSIGPVNNQVELTQLQQLPELTEEYAGQTVEVTVADSDGQIDSRQVTLRSEQEVRSGRDAGESIGYLGVVPIEYVLQRSTWSAPIVAAGLIKQFTELTLHGIGTALGSLITGQTERASEQVAGPVGIFVILRDGTLLGYQFVLLLIAIISLTLAIINALPIPALDGGRLFVTLLFVALNFIAGLFGKSVLLTKKIEERIHGTGFALLMVLFVLITIVDVRRFF